MKFYTTEAIPCCPGGAIVKARTKEHAAEVLNAELRKLGIPRAEQVSAKEMKLWPTPAEQVRFLVAAPKPPPF